MIMRISIKKQPFDKFHIEGPCHCTGVIGERMGDVCAGDENYHDDDDEVADDDDHDEDDDDNQPLT